MNHTIHILRQRKKTGSGTAEKGKELCRQNGKEKNQIAMQYRTGIENL
jgi:hypothetical protein